MHCIAHRLELGITKAIDEARLQRLNEVICFMYEQYYYSPKALREVRMLGGGFGGERGREFRFTLHGRQTKNLFCHVMIYACLSSVLILQAF